MGANLWYGVNLAKEKPDRLIEELDKLKDIGVTNLRVLAVTQGPNDAPLRIKPATELLKEGNAITDLNEEYMKALDSLIFEAGKRNMSVVMVINNFWYWSGGFAQYVNWFSDKKEPIPYPDKKDNKSHDKYIKYTQQFYKCTECMKAYDHLAERVISRKNTVSDIFYKDDPTIMAWELAYRLYPGDNSGEATKWINESCEKIKKIDTNHMVAIGNTGIIHDDYNSSIKLKCIDYGTFHVWPESFDWYDSYNGKNFDEVIEKTKEFIKDNVEKIHSQLKEINDDKPLVLEEFGLARDDRDLDISSTTHYRDRFFSIVFECLKDYMDIQKVSGANFWGWAGKGRPKNKIWKEGADWIGDPPSEDQGWLSIYDDDTTSEIIKEYAKLFAAPRMIEDHPLRWNFWMLIVVSVSVVVGGITIDLLKRKANTSEQDLLINEEL